MRFVLILLFFLTLFSVNSQSKSFISFQTGMNKMDVFSGFNYERKVSSIYCLATLELGLIKTVFQNRLFPRMTFGINYNLFTRNKISLLPEISYSFSILKIDVSHCWNEYYLGYKVLFGDRTQFYQSSKIGLMDEVFYSDLIGKRISSYCLGYNITVGVRYAL